ncbi:hypothetical protein E9536_39790 [Burkholderia sp. LS-044]|uniref:hypothetical protein n=1 Tax=Burkholderia sp. LS-044 TaxID=1459967 RepID=UPI0010A62666|nr:hypothetical protein [Burkholderia sp. LS-044]THJ46357.1 hypothetical protein E9536_39790 [Burkholderia sp. LS-044]
MTTDAEYIERVKAYKWGELTNLWQQIQNCSTPDWDPGKALEYLVLKGFELGKAVVRWPYNVDIMGASNVEQIDGLVYVGGIVAMIECKDYSDVKKKTKINVNFEPVAKLRNQLARRPSGIIGCIFSSGGYTEPAQTLMNFTKPETILCWSGSDIGHCIRKKNFVDALHIKYQKCVEQGIHDFDVASLELKV